MSSVLESPVVTVEEESPYLFTTEEFYRLLDLEFFPEEARVELWEARIYEKMAKKRPHFIAWSKLNAALMPIIPEAWSLWAECSITLGPGQVPLPDVVILRGKPDDYRDRHPESTDVGLIVELADSSLRIDIGKKLAAYAKAGVVAYLDAQPEGQGNSRV